MKGINQARLLETLLAETGLKRWPAFHRDPWFLAALGAAMPVWLGISLWAPASGGRSVTVGMAISLFLGQPVIEELVFRGILQGQLRLTQLGQKRLAGFTYANLLTSIVFTVTHFLHHPPLWALGVFLPSIAFGFFRDRHDSVYPSMALHIYYNTGVFISNGIAT